MNKIIQPPIALTLPAVVGWVVFVIGTIAVVRLIPGVPAKLKP